MRGFAIGSGTLRYDFDGNDLNNLTFGEDELSLAAGQSLKKSNPKPSPEATVGTVAYVDPVVKEAMAAMVIEFDMQRVPPEANGVLAAAVGQAWALLGLSHAWLLHSTRSWPWQHGRIRFCMSRGHISYLLIRAEACGNRVRLCS